MDPLPSDSPLEALLRLRHNPLVHEMTEDQLMACVRNLREAAQNNAKMNAAIREDSERAKPTTKAALRKALLDSI